jgi:hypothetical protein
MEENLDAEISKQDELTVQLAKDSHERANLKNERD